MATIRKTKSGKWNVQIRSKGRVIASKTLASYEAAQQWSEKAQARLCPQHPLFIDVGHQYCQTVLNEKPSQRIAYNRIDRISRSEFLLKPMNKITLQDVNAFKQGRLLEASSTTCRDELLMIRRVFRWYILELQARSGEIIFNPCELLIVPKANKTRDRVISAEELQLLMSAMTPQMAVIVEIAFETAMRRSEILKLTPKDLRLEDRYLCVVDGKEGSRDVPLTRRAVGLLQAALEGCEGRDAKLFPVAAYSVTQSVRRAREAVGLDSDVRFHQLRHSRISAVARKGFNQAQIMMVSGHRDIRSVQRYTHLNVRDVIDLLE